MWFILLALLAGGGFGGPGLAATGRARVEVGELILEAPMELRPQQEELARRAAAILPRLKADLGVLRIEPFRILLIPAGPLQDPEMARLDAAAPPWAAGFYVPRWRVGAIRVAQADRYPYGDLPSVLAHEMAHVLLHDAAGEQLPRWFEEGVATREGRRWGLRDIYVYSSMLLTGGLPTLDEVSRGFGESEARARAAYAASFDFVSRTVELHGEGVIRDILAGAAEQPFPEAWRAATGVALSHSEARWRRGSLLRYRWIPALTATTTLWIGVTALVFLARARRRARSRRILERWRREDAAEEDSTAVH